MAGPDLQKEQDEARVRLAKANVFNLMDPLIQKTEVDDAVAASRRIDGLVGADPKSLRSLTLLADIVKMLREAELTMNFQAWKWFASEVKGDTYLNVYQLRELLQSQGKSGGAFTDGRPAGEEKMFAYSKGSTGAPTNRHGAVAEQIKTLGATAFDAQKAPQSPTFRSSMRPGYAAVNWGKHRWGGAPQYGYSYFVLRHYVRFNATFSHRDSLNAEVGRETLSSYHHLFRIPLLADEEVVREMIRRVDGNTQEYHCPQNKYIEAQIHMDVRFDRDIERWVIYKPIVDTDQYVKDRKERSALIANIEKFARKVGCKPDYVN